VRFFFKQWSGRNAKAAGRELDGVTWDEMPGAPGELVSLTIRTAE
jgi:protein gp37